METREFTITAHSDRRPRRKRRSMWRAYARLSLLALAAMVTARLLLLMIDVIQLQIDTVGAISIPLCGIVLVVTGWKLREWTEATRKESRPCVRSSGKHLAKRAS